MRAFRFFNYCGFILIFIISFSALPLNNQWQEAPDRAQLRVNTDLLSAPSTFEQLTQGIATGPLFVNPDNPRYFTDGTIVNGKYKAVLLTGSHTWCDFMDCGSSNPPPAFDYTAFLDFLQTNNNNFFRFWRAENARGGEQGNNFWFSPMPYKRSSTCCAFDGGNKYDLSQFNQVYFDRMRSRIIEAGNRGIYVSIMLFDGWSVESKKSNHHPWLGHPFNLANNVNGTNGDPNANDNGEEVQTLNTPETSTQQVILPLEEAYVRKVIDTVNDLDNVLYEVGNESTGSSANTSWQYHMIDFIKSYESTKPKQHPVGMTVQYPNGSNATLYASSADWISPNGDVENPPVADGSKVVLYDTDHLCGYCGDRTWVWESFTRGMNPVFMDPYNKAYTGRGAPSNYDPNNAIDVSLRHNLGYALAYADQINLSAMTPTSNTSLCSTGYCLRNPVASGAEYLVYNPGGGNIIVNLFAVPASKSLNVEWFNPSTGLTTFGIPVNGGVQRTFTPPFSGDAVLYIYNSTFVDVTPANMFWGFIEGLYNAGITGGCNTNPLQYCPETAVTRDQMAVFLLRGVHGDSYTPPLVGISTGFADVPTNHWAAPSKLRRP